MQCIHVQWIWITIIILNTAGLITFLRRLYQDPVVTPTDYFTFCGKIANILRHIVFHITTWTKQKHFHKALNLGDKFWRQTYMQRKGMIVRCLFHYPFPDGLYTGLSKPVSNGKGSTVWNFEKEAPSRSWA